MLSQADLLQRLPCLLHSYHDQDFEKSARAKELMVFICERLLKQLVDAGEIIVVDDVSTLSFSNDKVSWVFTDVQWMTRDIVGQIVKGVSYLLNDSGEEEVAEALVSSTQLDHLALSAECIDAVTNGAASKYFRGDTSVVPELLATIGLFARIPGKNKTEDRYLPVFMLKRALMSEALEGGSLHSTKVQARGC